MRQLTFMLLIPFLFSCQNNKIEMKNQIPIQKDNDMNVLGLIGGTSWHSTIDYYRYINESVNDHYGNNTNPPLLVYTMDQAQVHKYQVEDNWDGIADLLVEGGKRLQNAGAEKLMFCANTPHKVYDQVESQLNVPIIHIADATAETIIKRGLEKVAFLGTDFQWTRKEFSRKFHSPPERN